MTTGDAGTGAVVRSVATPYYLQIAAILRGGITAGKWEPGQLIPSEASLCAMFGVSRTAIRQALAQLVAEGMLHKEKGRGTFVARPHVAVSVQELRGVFDEMTAAGRTVTTDVLRQEAVAAPVAIAQILEVPVGAPTMCLERVRHVGDEPLVHATTYLPMPRFAALLDVDFTHNSLYAVLDEQYDVRPSGGLRRLEAVNATSAQARRLGIRARDAVLRLTATNLDSAGVAFEAFEAIYRGDRAVFDAVLEARH